MKTGAFLCMLLPMILLGQLSIASFSFEIDGEIKGLGNEPVFIMVNHYADNGPWLYTDTINIKSVADKFRYKGELATPKYVWASIGSLRSGKSFSFFLEKGYIKIRGAMVALNDIRVSGTPGNNDLMLSNKMNQRHYDEAMALRNRLTELRPSTLAYDSISRLVSMQYDSVTIERVSFIRAHPHSLASSIDLYVLQDRLPVAEVETLYKMLDPAARKVDLLLKLPAKIQAKKNVAVGNLAPDFSAPDSSGKIISLHNFRGHYVLLEFWANWCVPCRKQNPQWVALYNRFADKGFRILQFSMDVKNDEEKWKAAIRKDGLSWYQVSDLQGFQSPVVQAYGVQPIPDNFLIDPNGKILARGLEPDAIEKKLTELLNK